MAQITYTTIDDNAVRSVTAPNTFYSAYNTASTTLTGANFANEGLDERSIVSNAATDGWDSVEYDGGTVGPLASLGVSIPLVLGAVTFSLDNGGLGWVVGRDIGVVRVRFQTSFSYTYAASPAESEILTLRLMTQYDGGAFSNVVHRFRFQARDEMAYGVFGTEYNDNLKFGFAIPYAIDNASHTLNVARIEYETSGAVGFSFSNTTFQAVRFVRAGVL